MGHFKRDPQRSREMHLDSIAIFQKKKMLPSVNTGKWAKEKERKKETTGDLDQDALHREKRVVLFERFYFSVVRFPCRFCNIT